MLTLSFSQGPERLLRLSGGGDPGSPSLPALPLASAPFSHSRLSTTCDRVCAAIQGAHRRVAGPEESHVLEFPDKRSHSFWGAQCHPTVPPYAPAHSTHCLPQAL